MSRRGDHLKPLWALLFLLAGPSSLAHDDQTSETAQRLLTRGKAHARALEFDHAFADLKNALTVVQDLENPYLEVEVLLALGHTYRVSGAPRRGFRWILEGIDRIESFPPDPRKARILCSLARARNAVGENEEGRKNLEEALEIFQQAGDQEGIVLATSHQALLALHARRYPEALDFGEKVLASTLGEPEDRLLAVAAVAYSNHNLGHLDQAARAYDQVIDLASTLNDQTQLNFAYCNRAEVRWQMGEKRPVQDDLSKAIEGFEKGRALIAGNPEDRANFLSRQVAAYDRLIRLLVDTSQGRAAFEIAERFHGRSFLELLDEPALAVLARKRPDLEARRREVLSRLGQARLELARQKSSPPELRAQHDLLETELLDLQADLLWNDRDPRRDGLAVPPSQEQTQAGLDPGETLVAYWVTEDRTLIWAVQSDKTYFVQVKVTQEELEEQVRAYLEPLRSVHKAEDLALGINAEKEHLDIGRQLHDLLIGHLPGIVRSSKRLILVPDGVLHFLPFESLVTRCNASPEGAEGSQIIHAPYARCSFLGLEKPLSYSPSAGVFLSLRERHRQRRDASSSEQKTLLALAPAFEAPGLPTAELRQAFGQPAPLAFTREEVERIAALFPGANTLVNESASESQLKAEAGGYQLLHLATHGLVSDDLPMSSGLLLAEGQGEDGLLQAHEVLGLELEADLVTLSACRSGRGQLGRGEGVFGLSRSFLTAGAASVLVSLWDVDDRSTPQLMESFYRHLAAGDPAPEALVAARRQLFKEQTEAKLVFRTRPLTYAHPRFWASFVLLGGF